MVRRAIASSDRAPTNADERRAVNHPVPPEDPEHPTPDVEVVITGAALQSPDERDAGCSIWMSRTSAGGAHQSRRCPQATPVLHDPVAALLGEDRHSVGDHPDPPRAFAEPIAFALPDVGGTKYAVPRPSFPPALSSGLHQRSCSVGANHAS